MALTAEQKKKYIKLGAIGVAILIVLIAVISTYSPINSARGGALTRENAIAAQYHANTNELSTNIIIANVTSRIVER